MMSMRRLLQNRTCRGILIGLVCALVCWGLSKLSVVQSLENWALDYCYVFRSNRTGPTEIVIVALDDATLDSFKKPMMLITPELAEVVRHVRDRGAKAVGIDVLVPYSMGDVPELLVGAAGDATRLGKELSRESGCPVVLPELFVASDTSWVFPIKQWQPLSMQQLADDMVASSLATYESTVLIGDGNDAFKAMAFANTNPDADMVVRRQRLRIQWSDAEADDPQIHFEPSFAFAVFAAAMNFNEESLERLRYRSDSDVQIPVDNDDRVLINYRGPAGTIPRVSFKTVLDAARDAKGAGGDAMYWRNKIVLIGTTTVAGPDQLATPFSTPSLARLLWARQEPQLMPGVEIHANTIATLADRAFITTPWWLSAPVLLPLFGVAMGIALVKVRLETGVLITFVHHWLWKVVCVAAFYFWSWRVEMISMLTLGLLVFTVVFAMRWRWMRQMLGMIKSEAIARALEAEPATLNLQGEEREITIMFSDIRGFTAYSEHHTPPEVVKMLNAYFSVVVPVIERHGGIVNQYMGDGIQVLFGAPERNPQHAAQAVRAAIDMVNHVHERKRLWEQLGAPDFRIGVGINTGRVVVGTVGSSQRLDYTAIGDPTNTAARIEAANKELGTEILASADTVSRLPIELSCAVGRAYELSVKGKQTQLTVHAIESRPAACGAQEKDLANAV